MPQRPTTCSPAPKTASFSTGVLYLLDATSRSALTVCRVVSCRVCADVKAIQQVSGRGASQLVANDEVIEEVGNSRRVVVTDKLGINSFHVNPETNVLVSAGDTHSLQFRSSVVLQY